MLNRYREGLIIGSACEAGELYKAVLNDRDEETIENSPSNLLYLYLF